MPTMVFVDQAGIEIDRFLGYLPPEEYLEKITSIRNGKNTFVDCLHRYENGERNAELIYILAEKYSEKQNSEEAGSLYQELLDTFPNIDDDKKMTAIYQLAYAEFENENINPINDFIQEYPTSQQSQQALMSMARYYEGKENKISELNTYLRLINNFPENPNVLNSYAWRMSELGFNLEDALIKVQYAVDMVKKDHNYSPSQRANMIDTEAEVLWKLNRFDDAILTIERAIILDASNEYFMEQKMKFMNSKKEKNHVPA